MPGEGKGKGKGKGKGRDLLATLGFAESACWYCFPPHAAVAPQPSPAFSLGLKGLVGRSSRR